MIYVQCYSFGSHGSVDDDVEVRFRQGKFVGNVENCPIRHLFTERVLEMKLQQKVVRKHTVGVYPLSPVPVSPTSTILMRDSR